MRFLPAIEGLIRRRLLLNFRAEPEVVQRLLPSPLRPKLHRGHAILGICLIRLEQIRPPRLPAALGASSENAAHRIAVEWETHGECREGVFIPRRDTNSRINAALGGRLIPGEHHHAAFSVREGLRWVDLEMLSSDRSALVELSARLSSALPRGSVFQSLSESSSFFEGGCLGYSTTKDPCRLNGLRLETSRWQVRPLDVRYVRSSFFDDPNRFPNGSITFDHGLIMRNVLHRWHSEPDLRVGRLPVEDPT